MGNAKCKYTRSFKSVKIAQSWQVNHLKTAQNPNGDNMRYVILCILLIGSIIFTCTNAQTSYKNYQKPKDEILKKKLMPMQYQVTQQQGTEPPFNNAYWNNKKPGIYVDIVSGEPLFISLDKYDSKTGWPSFTKPLEPDNIILKPDNTILPARVEVVSKYAHSHLGHVFEDGPPPTYKRYCINSAALEFIPLEDLQKRGYGKYLYLFKR